MEFYKTDKDISVAKTLFEIASLETVNRVYEESLTNLKKVLGMLLQFFFFNFPTWLIFYLFLDILENQPETSRTKNKILTAKLKKAEVFANKNMYPEAFDLIEDVLGNKLIILFKFSTYFFFIFCSYLKIKKKKIHQRYCRYIVFKGNLFEQYRKV